MGVPGSNGQLLRGWLGNGLNGLCSGTSSCPWPNTRTWARASDASAPPATGSDSLPGYVEKITNYPDATTAPVTSGWEPGPDTGENTVGFVDFIETEVEQACLHQDPSIQDIWEWLEDDASEPTQSVPATVVGWIATLTTNFSKQPSA